ncbi:MAG: hypothetical protein ACREKL_03875 [Chthoniobacterales bacterium]
MKSARLFLLVALTAAFAGCQTMLNPTLTKEEREVLAFNVDGVTIGGPSGQLAKFSQVQHIPVKLGGYDVYEIYNATPSISEIKCWYFDNKLKRIELRYFNGRGVNTLTRAGGWDGIRNYLMGKYGPPSRFGSDVPIMATKGEWNAKYAKFNGEWIFSRIKRQISYSAMADAGDGIAVVTVMDTTPVEMPRMVAEPASTPTPVKTTAPVPQEVAPRAANPGF